MTRKVVIEVYGGVADITSAPEGIEVVIVDWDNVEEGDQNAIEIANQMLAEGYVSDHDGLLESEEELDERVMEQMVDEGYVSRDRLLYGIE